MSNDETKDWIVVEFKYDNSELSVLKYETEWIENLPVRLKKSLANAFLYSLEKENENIRINIL